MRATAALCVITILACSPTAHAQERSSAASGGTDGNACAPAQQATDRPAEPAGIGAGLVLDEHVLTDASRDQDYNGGGEVTRSGRTPGIVGRSLDQALGFIDMYVQETQPVPPPLPDGAPPEVFAFAGARLKARA